MSQEALKYDKGLDKLPWDLLPYKATDGMLRILLYGMRKYTTCNKCKSVDEKGIEGPTRIYPKPRLIDGDVPRSDCPKCGSKDISSGAHNWRRGFTWTRLIAAAFRHLRAIAGGQDQDPESGEPHAAHLLCMVAFLLEHQIDGLGVDDRYKRP